MAARAVNRGDIEMAFNLIPEQVPSIKDDPYLRVQEPESLDTPIVERGVSRLGRETPELRTRPAMIHYGSYCHPCRRRGRNRSAATLGCPSGKGSVTIIRPQSSGAIWPLPRASFTQT